MVGTVTISIEVELAWGRHDLSTDGSLLSEHRREETAALQRLLSTCDEYDVPISFDVVGHLFHEACTGNHESPHDPDWFEADPGTGVDADPRFYAPDLIEAIDEADTDHEICTHTYSHALCDEISPATLNWELDQVEAVHEAAGLDSPRSFVAPRHRRADRSILRDHGIDVVRRPFPDHEPYDGDGIRAFLQQYARSHPLRDAEVVDGVLETYCTPRPSLTAPFLQIGQRPPRREHAAVPRRLRQRIHRRYLETSLSDAAEKDRDLHLWSHLYNLSNDAQWPPIRSFLSTLANRRDSGRVEIETMAGLRSGR